MRGGERGAHIASYSDYGFTFGAELAFTLRICAPCFPLLPTSMGQVGLRRLKRLHLCNALIKVAVGVGFEPTEGINPQRFSRPPLSTTQPAHQIQIVYLPSGAVRLYSDEDATQAAACCCGLCFTSRIARRLCHFRIVFGSAWIILGTRYIRTAALCGRRY